MKTLPGIAFALIAGLSLVADAAPLPFGQNTLQPEQKPQVVNEQPEPSGLSTHWWRYLEVKDPEKLKARIQTMLTRLDALLEELPKELIATARPSVELIRTNLQALPKAKAKQGPADPPPPAYRENYTLRQLLDMATKRRKIKTDLQASREDAATMSKAIRAATRRLDTLLAAYLNLSSTDPNRVLRGLEIMAERSAVAVAEERLRVLRAELVADEKRLEYLRNQQAVAAERLTANTDRLEQLAQEIETARTGLQQAQQQSIGAKARAMSVVVDEDAAERATAQYRQQLAVQTEVVEAIATLRLIKLEAELDLTALLLPEIEIEIDYAVIHSQLAGWQQQLEVIRERILDWRSSSERERDRASDLVASTTTEEDKPSDVTFINMLDQNRLKLAQDTLLGLQRLGSELAEADLILELVDTHLVAREGRLRAWLVLAQQGLEQLWDGATGSVSASLFRLGDTPVTTLGLFRVILIIFIAWSISYWLRQALTRLGERGEGDNLAAFYTVGRLSHYIIITIGFMVGLSSIGLDFTNFALFAGALAIGIGFGLQSIVNNFVSGLILLFDRSLKVGDFVELQSGISGEVREIKVRSTVINTNDNVDIVVPNSEFMVTDVTNWTLTETYRRIHIPFKVAYGSDKDAVRKAGLEAAEKLPHTLLGVPGRTPGVWLVSFGDSGLDFELVVWVTPRAVKRPGAVHAAYMWEIETALRKHGIEIPIPQRDLHLRSGFTATERQSRPEIATSVFTPRLQKSQQKPAS